VNRAAEGGSGRKRGTLPGVAEWEGPVGHPQESCAVVRVRLTGQIVKRQLEKGELKDGEWALRPLKMHSERRLSRLKYNGKPHSIPVHLRRNCEERGGGGERSVLPAVGGLVFKV